MTAPRDVYMINYYPAAGGGYLMWSSYDGPQYSADLQVIKDLGFNTVRVFCAARDGVFDFPSPTSAELASLADFCRRAHDAGVLVHLTLFDFWRSFGLIAGAQQWACAVLGAIPDLAYLQCVEIKNEIRFGSVADYSSGFDRGWPAGTPQYREIGQVATVWAQHMVPYIRGITGGSTPVTASTTNGTTNIQPYYEAVNGTPAAPDWYEWHCYVVPQLVASARNIAGISSVAYRALSQIVAVVGDPALLFIGETGINTTPGAGGNASLPAQIGPAQAGQAQLNYIQGVRWACQQLSLPEPAPWILYDLPPGSGAFPQGQTFGLYTTSGQPKPVVAHYQQVPPGSAIPGVGINGRMLGPPQADGQGNVLPPQWALYQGQRNGQPIAATVDDQNTWQSGPSVRLTGSAGTSPDDNPPALEVGWPLLTGQNGQNGQTITFSAALKAEGSYGRPRLHIAFYSFAFTGSSFVSSRGGPVLTLTDEFEVVSFTATIPAGADYARLFVQAGYNAGSIWVAGASAGAAFRLLAG
jgi:hypothetical protein